MQYTSLSDFFNNGLSQLPSGPVALIFAEDEVEIEATVRHHLLCGFDAIVLMMPERFRLNSTATELVSRVNVETAADGAVPEAVNAIIQHMPGRWLYYCYNTEFLFYPFCETRSISEMLAFHEQERRDAMIAYVVDLYARDLKNATFGVNVSEAYMDSVGYYALARPDPANHNHPKERQLDFFGGLRWRFEEHVPQSRRKIDRVALFKAKPGLRLLDDHTFNDQEYNTYACPWHSNLTSAIVSFRTAKALKLNPGSNDAIQSFVWRESTEFDWSSRKLMDLGLMDPAQWF
ncbi:glycosyltransferase family 2 protein [Pseudoprimorskyibacter insulae]|uniref:Uncharacterized protein n=1 Tax=Pseudoprimorskyibacter insulae TaxID=1695997 RepID=A0A2R8AY98_9RHOB|nr:glycosyltransferase family 2 protein [Pseudoprimorskyibacter insulae]SPF81015.1 hypothetical protein PRI8871_02831 [Pseudoprimorskyibacter insulae]